MAGPRAFQSDQFGRTRTVRLSPSAATSSRLAKASGICGLIFFVPLMPVAALVTGVAALRQIGATPGLHGKRWAHLGLVCGAVFTILQATVAMQAYRVYQFASNGPRTAMRQAFAGNTAAFRGQFCGPGRSGSDEDIEHFTETLLTRYGVFVDLRSVSGGDLVTCPKTGCITGEYLAEFDDQSLPAQVRIAICDRGGDGMFATRIEEIRIDDPMRGGLVYPADPQVVSAAQRGQD